MNLDGTRPNPGKTRVYLQKSRFTRKIPGRVPTNVCRARRHIALSQGQCATCGAQLLLKYAHRTMCCRYACLKAAAAKRRARHADGSADDAVAMCSASRSWRCLACTSAIPISSSQRSSATSWLLPTRSYASYLHARIVQRGPAYTGFHFSCAIICHREGGRGGVGAAASSRLQILASQSKMAARAPVRAPACLSSP